MFRTIVVGCDDSDRTADALALAQQLRHPQGRLLLAVVNPTSARCRTGAAATPTASS